MSSKKNRNRHQRPASGRSTPASNNDRSPQPLRDPLSLNQQRPFSPHGFSQGAYNVLPNHHPHQLFLQNQQLPPPNYHHQQQQMYPQQVLRYQYQQQQQIRPRWNHPKAYPQNIEPNLGHKMQQSPASSDGTNSASKPDLPPPYDQAVGFVKKREQGTSALFNRSTAQRQTAGRGGVNKTPNVNSPKHRGPRGKRRRVSKENIDKKSDSDSPTEDESRQSVVSEQSVMEEDTTELSVEYQRQLIAELAITTSQKDRKCLGIDVTQGDADYHPFALKNFLEYCTGGQCSVSDLITSHDKRSAVAIFDQEIDYDELVHFICEPCNQFLDLDLEFEEVNESSAVILFTDENNDHMEFYQKVLDMFEDAHPPIREKIRNQKSDADYLLISFGDSTPQDIQMLLDGMRVKHPDVEVYPLYVYPDDNCMYVTKESYINYTAQEYAVKELPPMDYSVLMTQVSADSSESVLRKIMTLKSQSGGDSSARITPTDTPSHKVVTYSTPEVACEVVSRSPVVYKEKTICHTTLCAGVPEGNSNSAISSYFLLLTGLKKDWPTRDVIMYVCANSCGHAVSQVYFSTDDTVAIVMFSTVGSKTPDYTNLYSGLKTPLLEGIRAWRVKVVTQVEVNGSSGSDTKTINKQAQSWSQDADVKVKFLSKLNNIVTLDFETERDVVKFLSRSADESQTALRTRCPETPVVPALSDTSLHLERDALSPTPLPITRLVEEDLGYSRDHLKYFCKGGNIRSQLQKRLKAVQAYYGKGEADNEIRPDMTGPTTIFINWQNQVTQTVDGFLKALKVMDEYTVSKSHWNAIKTKINPDLCVIDESDNSRQVRVRAIGNATLVEKFEERLTAGADEKSSGGFSENVTMSIAEAEFIRHRGIHTLQGEFPDCEFKVNIGNELGSVLLKAKDKESLSKAKERLMEYKSSLCKRNITMSGAFWEFLNSRTSHAFSHINKMLEKYNVHYRTTTSGKNNHKLVTLTTEPDTKSNLNDAEKWLRENIVMESAIIAPAERWQSEIIPAVERYMRNRRLPFHIIKPEGGEGKVQIVTVMAAQEELREILSAKPGESEQTDGGAKPKKKKGPKNKTNSGDSNIVVTPLLAVDLLSGSREKQRRRESEGRVQDDLIDLVSHMKVRHGSGSSAGGSSVYTPRGRTYSGSSAGDAIANGEIRLSHNHQHIEFKFCQRFVDEIVTDDVMASCDLKYNDKDKVIKILSNSEQDMKGAKQAILRMVKSLKKYTEIIRDKSVAIDYFQKAAEDLKVRFFVHDSHKIIDYRIGEVRSVVACSPSIQCVQADAMVIAVTKELDMYQSGIGCVLAIADPNAARALKRRYAAESPDKPGSCQELESNTTSTLYDRYIVIVVDPKDQSSLEIGFNKALQQACRMGVSSLVTNLIGSDMRGFITKEKSAEMILRCISQQEKTMLTSIYICETNKHKMKMLTDQMKKCGKGIDYKENNQPAVGERVLSVCSYTKRDAVEFLSRCDSVLRR